MKVCIQDSATRKFLCGAMTWVDNVEKALSFGNSLEAFRHCARAGLTNVRLLVDQGLSRPPIVIPVETSRLTNRPMTGFPEKDTSQHSRLPETAAIALSLKVE